MNKLAYLLVISIFFFSCSNTEKDNTESTDSTEVTENIDVSIDMNKLNEKLRNWRGGAFFKAASANNGNIKVVYVNDFNDLKATYPVITSTEADYKKEMGKAFLIDKMLAELPVKIFLKFTNANSVSLNIPFEGITYKVVLTKEDIENFTGNSFSEIVENYSENYSDKYVFDEEGRAKFIAKFVKK